MYMFFMVKPFVKRNALQLTTTFDALGALLPLPPKIDDVSEN